MANEDPPADASPPESGPPPGAPPPEGGAGSEEAPRIIPSDEIFHGEREVHIVHGGVVYRLLITKTGKLLLHK